MKYRIIKKYGVNSDCSIYEYYMLERKIVHKRLFSQKIYWDTKYSGTLDGCKQYVKCEKLKEKFRSTPIEIVEYL
jgi:hypothetical protein